MSNPQFVETSSKRRGASLPLRTVARSLAIGVGTILFAGVACTKTSTEATVSGDRSAGADTSDSTPNSERTPPVVIPPDVQASLRQEQDAYVDGGTLERNGVVTHIDVNGGRRTITKSIGGIVFYEVTESADRETTRLDVDKNGTFDFQRVAFRDGEKMTTIEANDADEDGVFESETRTREDDDGGVVIVKIRREKTDGGLVVVEDPPVTIAPATLRASGAPRSDTYPCDKPLPNGEAQRGIIPLEDTTPIAGTSVRVVTATSNPYNCAADFNLISAAVSAIKHMNGAYLSVVDPDLGGRVAKLVNGGGSYRPPYPIIDCGVCPSSGADGYTRPGTINRGSAVRISLLRGLGWFRLLVTTAHELLHAAGLRGNPIHLQENDPWLNLYGDVYACSRALTCTDFAKEHDIREGLAPVEVNRLGRADCDACVRTMLERTGRKTNNTLRFFCDFDYRPSLATVPCGALSNVPQVCIDDNRDPTPDLEIAASCRVEDYRFCGAHGISRDTAGAHILPDNLFPFGGESLEPADLPYACTVSCPGNLPDNHGASCESSYMASSGWWYDWQFGNTPGQPTKTFPYLFGSDYCDSNEMHNCSIAPRWCPSWLL